MSAKQLSDVGTWRAAHRHTGIDKTGSIPYTYEHVPGPLPPHAEVYRVECYVPFVAPTPIHRNVYYVPGHQLDEFFKGWGDHEEIVIDVQPLTITAALDEIDHFRMSKEA